jgi:NADP-dependent 3-hydroxy acid dehydrogenase YdfG
MSELKVMVTGASRGIGRAIALRFAKEGARVVIGARTATALDELAAEIDALGGVGIPCQMNVADLGNVEAGLWRALEATDGVLDVLVNNAGIFEIKPITEMHANDFTRMIEVNLNGAFYCTLEAIDGLLASKRAHIINISSTAGQRGYAGSSAYCASKYGLRGLSDALREELGVKGIRVSTVYPDATDTTIFDNVPGDWDRSKMNTPEDVAEVVWQTYNAPPDADVADVNVPPPAGA